MHVTSLDVNIWTSHKRVVYLGFSGLLRHSSLVGGREGFEPSPDSTKTSL